jgi:hypothetical protein
MGATGSAHWFRDEELDRLSCLLLTADLGDLRGG